MNIMKTVNHWVKQHTLILPDQTIVIGLSGGPDSVFLLHYLAGLQQTLRLTLIAAHLDHEWRESSAQDAQFCTKLAELMQITLVSKRISELAYHVKPSGSKEQDARNARRYFFEQVANDYKANTIALAQHKNDQEETFFIRLLRGSSLTGLTGMWPKRGPYIRPLLSCTKADILAWLSAHHIAYVIDPTNASPDYLRNRIRHELLPIIRNIDNRFDINVTKTLAHLQETELFLQKLTLSTFTTLAHFNEELQAYQINLKALLVHDRVMQYRLIMHWFMLEKAPFPASQGFLDEVLRFLHQPTSKEHTIHEHWRLIKHKQNCHIIPIKQS